jgi:hypothetical protein
VPFCDDEVDVGLVQFRTRGADIVGVTRASQIAALLCGVATVAACGGSSSAPTATPPKPAVRCVTWSPCMTALASHLGATVIAPPASGTDTLALTRMDPGTVQYLYRLGSSPGISEVVTVNAGPVRALPTTSHTGESVVTATTVRGHPAAETTLTDGHTLTWDEGHRTWMVAFPDTTSVKRVRSDLRTFSAYQA